MPFATASPYFYYFLLFAVCGYAVYRGGRPERIGAAILLIGSIVSTAGSGLLATAWTGVDSSTFVVDMLILLAFLHLALVSDRFWPIWVTGLHLVAVSIHVATAVSPNLAPWALATGAAFWAFPMLFVLALGAHEHVRLADMPAVQPD